MGRKLLYLKELWDVTPGEIILTGGLGLDGEPLELGRWQGKLNFSEKAKSIQDKNGVWVRLSGVIHVCGDVLPGIIFREGSVFIAGYEKEFKIVSYSRPRNPDGSVNHTRIEVI